MVDKDCKQHYHMIYSKKLLHGVVKVEVNLLAPRSEMAEAFAAVEEIVRRDLLGQTETTSNEMLVHRACDRIRREFEHFFDPTKPPTDETSPDT